MIGSGIRLTLLIGPTVAVPAPPLLVDALENVSVTHTDEEASGFQITFRVGRDSGALRDYALLSNPLLKPYTRVILVVHFGAMPKVLMDGIITNQELDPGDEPGTSTLTVTGDDVTVMMDRKTEEKEHPSQDDATIARKIIGRYARYGLIPKVIPPKTMDRPVATERVPVQVVNDLQYLQEMAGRHGYVFYVTPGSAPFTNQAYWGPQIRVGKPQRALTVDMGHVTNVDSIRFRHDALLPTLVSGRVQDRKTNRTVKVRSFGMTRVPLAAQSVLTTQRANARQVPLRESGLTAAQAFGRAKRETDVSMDQVVTASGELDAARYGDLLKARELVGLRGVGWSHDGLYYVKTVTHELRPGSYKQSFTLTREGLGTTVPGVIP
jgi:hypothetical protein